jgi:hypothetical protein
MVKLTINYGYDIHSIEVSQSTLDRIRAGDANAVAFADLGHSCSPGCSAIGRGPEHASSVRWGHADRVTLSTHGRTASFRWPQPIVTR